MGLKARARGDVELEVRVVHAVQPPQRRHRVKKNVLQVDGQIEQDHSEHDRCPGGQIERREQAPAAGLGEQGDADGGYREEEAHEERVERNDADVARPAAPAADPLPAAGGKYLPRGHERKHAAEREEANSGLPERRVALMIAFRRG